MIGAVNSSLFIPHPRHMPQVVVMFCDLPEQIPCEQCVTNPIFDTEYVK